MACTYECWWQRQKQEWAPGCQQDSGGGGGCLHSHLVLEAWHAEMLCQYSKECRAGVLIVLLCPFSGHPGLWDVLSWGGVASGEEANWHCRDCLLWLPPRKRHLSVSGWEWNLSCKGWRSSWIHCEFTQLSCSTTVLLSSKLEGKIMSMSSCCADEASSLDNSWDMEKSPLGGHFHGCRNMDGN